MGVAAVAAGVVAVWVTLPADFLRYPAWLAAQKADFVIGPVLTGLYWMRRRPQSPFGPMLIAWGVVGALYILQSSSDSWLFSIGLFWEKVFGLATYVLILAFPTGRLDRAVEGRAGRRCRHRAAAGRGDPARAAAGRRGRLDLQLPVAVPAQRARLHVGPGAGARPVRGVQLRRPRARPRGRGGGGPSLRHRHAAAEAGVGHRHARRPAVPAVRDPLSAADDRGRRRQRAVRHRDLGVRGRPRGRLVRLPVRVDRRRAVRRARDGATGRAVAATTPRSRSSR